MFNTIFQFAPRFFGTVIFLALTWFVARLTQSVFSRSLACCEKTEKRGILISKIAFWSVFGLMTPFILSNAGINLNWLYSVQLMIAGIMKAWPVWFALSLCAGCVFFVIRETPKVITSFRTMIQTHEL
jgi:hypothetical protein